MKKILVKLPTFGRPKQFRDVCSSLIATQSKEGDIHYLFSFDQDDPHANDMAEFVTAAFGMCGHSAESVIGTSQSKIHAINRDINECTYPWDILVVGSDDMWPVKQGWDTIIREGFERHLPDMDGMLWFPDGYQKRISTMPIMGRTYYSRFGYVYHPEYRSFFCDNEQTQIAQAHGKMIYIEEQLFDHRHPGNTKAAKNDETYTRANADWDRDKLIYQRRRLQGFPQ